MKRSKRGQSKHNSQVRKDVKRLVDQAATNSMEASSTARQPGQFGVLKNFII
jgi:hypothetical protein